MREKVGNRSSQALPIKAPNHPRSRKTLPCSKGIETPKPLRFDIILSVERPRPVLKGLRLMLITVPVETLPCSKGIETHKSVLVIHVDQSKAPPCSKGIEAFKVKPGKNPQECVVCNTQKTGNTKC